jgi:hypothetical protein
MAHREEATDFRHARQRRVRETATREDIDWLVMMGRQGSHHRGKLDHVAQGTGANEKNGAIHEHDAERNGEDEEPV